MYNAYGNRAEDVIRNEYNNYIRERSVKNMRHPKVITRYKNPKAELIKLKIVEPRAAISANIYKSDFPFLVYLSC